MKIIEEPSFQMEDSKGFDKLVEREMETLEGGFCDPIIGCTFCSPISGGGSKTTTTSPTTTSSTTAAFTTM